jgi:hypothetical protein
VYAPAERAGTLHLIHLFPYVLCRLDLDIPREHRVHIRVVQCTYRGREEIWGVFLQRGVSIEGNGVLKALLGIGIDTDAAGIPASGISFWYRTGSPYSATGLVPAMAFLIIRYWTDQITDSLAFQHSGIIKKGYIHPARPHCKQWMGIHPVCSHCAGRKDIHPARPYCWRWKGYNLDTLHVKERLLMVLLLLYDVEKT